MERQTNKYQHTNGKEHQTCRKCGTEVTESDYFEAGHDMLCSGCNYDRHRGPAADDIEWLLGE